MNMLLVQQDFIQAPSNYQQSLKFKIQARGEWNGNIRTAMQNRTLLKN